MSFLFGNLVCEVEACHFCWEILFVKLKCVILVWNIVCEVEACHFCLEILFVKLKHVILVWKYL